MTSLVVFEAAARRLSFARAADELCLTPSAVSHQIAKLEQFLGFLLFERTPRGIALSDAGESYLKRVAGALGAIGNATDDIRKGVRNALYVHSSPGIASLWLMPRLGQFVRAYPEISLSLSASPAISEFALGQVDIDIRYGVPEWPNLVVEPIFEERILPLASPDLLARQPIKTPAELLQRPLIQSTLSVVQWSAWFTSRGLIGVSDRFAFRFDRVQMSLDAAVQGLGVALESARMAARLIGDGLLRPVFDPEWSLPVEAHFLVYPERHARRTEVAQFLAWLREQARAAPAPLTAVSEKPRPLRKTRKSS
jgi:LysR family glycine cleavage system transcriptional activator